MNWKTNKIDWLNHSLEFVVVVIGILIAFQLNKCSADKSQSRTIDIHLNQIKQETALNKKSFEDAIRYAEFNLSKLDTVFRLISRKEDYPKVNKLSLELLNLGGVYIRENAYSTLLATGDIRLMKNFKRKNRIVNLYEYYKWVKSFDEIALSLYTDDFYPYLRDHFDFLSGAVQPEEVYQSKVFLNILAAYQRTNSNKIEKYKDCLLEIEDYLASDQ